MSHQKIGSSLIFSLEKMIAENRLLEMLQDEVKNASFFDEVLYQKISEYTEAYISAEGKEQVSPDKAYFGFIRSYNKDMKAFVETGKYPLEINPEREALNRFEYNIILFFSCLFTPHRFRIMQLIENKSLDVENGLFIGCGPGLEIELVKSKLKNLHAYDLTMDDFLFGKHPNVTFKQEYFDGKNSAQKYEAIYLIELLEHLDEPYQLLEICKTALADNGKIYLTTATNIPQFDHLYNFESDHSDFEKQIADLGFKIELMEDIPHGSITVNVGAKNRFYIVSHI